MSALKLKLPSQNFRDLHRCTHCVLLWILMETGFGFNAGWFGIWILGNGFWLCSQDANLKHIYLFVRYKDSSKKFGVLICMRTVECNIQAGLTQNLHAVCSDLMKPKNTSESWANATRLALEHYGHICAETEKKKQTLTREIKHSHRKLIL